MYCILITKLLCVYQLFAALSDQHVLNVLTRPIQILRAAYPVLQAAAWDNESYNNGWGTQQSNSVTKSPNVAETEQDISIIVEQ